MISSSHYALLLVLSLLTLSAAVHTPSLHIHTSHSELHDVNTHLQGSAAYVKLNDSLNTISSAITISPPAIAPVASSKIFNISTTDCQQLTSSERSNLNTLASSVQAKLKQLRTSLASVPVNAGNTQLRIDIQNLQTYTNVFAQLPTSKCSNNIILAPSAYQTNINSPRWMLGGWSMADLQNDYVQRSMNSQHVTNCPLDSPFLTSVGCIDCLTPNDIFNIQTGVCGNCPTGTSLDLKSRNCLLNTGQPIKISSVNPAAQTTPNVTVTHNATVPVQVNSSTPIVPNATSPSTAPKVSSAPNSPNTTANLTVTPTAPSNPLNTSNSTIPSTEPVKNVTTPSTVAAANTSTPANATTPTTPNASNSSQPIKIASASPPSSTVNETNSSNLTTVTNASSTTVTNTPVPSNLTSPHNVSNPANTTNTTTTTSTTTTITTSNSTNATVASPNITNTTNITKTTNVTTVTNTTNTTSPTNTTTTTIPVVVSAPSNVTNHVNETNATSPSNASKPSNTTNNTIPIPVTVIPSVNTTTPHNETDATSPHNETNATSPHNATIATSPSNATNATSTQKATNATLLTNTSSIPSINNTAPSNASVSNTTIPTNHTLTNVTNVTHPNPSNITKLVPNISNTASQSRVYNPSYIAPSSPFDIPCPLATPFFNGKDCIECVSPNNLFDSSKQLCYSCDNSSFFNSTSHNCQPKPANSTNPSSFNKLLIANGQLPANHSSDIPCPPELPFYNGSACIICNAPQYLFDVSKNNCSLCPDQTRYNETTHKCDVQNNDWLVAKNASNLVNAGMPTTYWNQNYDTLAAQNKNRKDCPADKPYYNGVVCINCVNDTKYFNLETRSCQSCNGTFVYDSTQRDCIDMSQSTFSVKPSTLKMSGSLFAHEGKMQHFFSMVRHQLKDDSNVHLSNN